MTMKKNSNRRALRDIGNLVGAFSSKCVISERAAGAENHVVGGGKNSITVSNRSVKRKSVATLAKNQDLPQVAPVAEKHAQCGAKKRKTMRSEREKPNLKPNVHKSMDDCRELDSMCSHPRIITRSRATLLKIDENDPMLVDSIVENKVTSREALLKMDEIYPMSVDSIVENKEDIDESSEMETDEGEDQVPNIDPMAPMPNIDEGDEGNPLAKDMSRFYREKEGLNCVPLDYMSQQNKINHNMRAVVLNWIVEVHLKLGLVPETLFLAINLIDRYVSSQRDLTKLVLPVVGITAMLVACKHVETNGPCLKDFMNICNCICTENDVLQMESSMLRVLQFNICVPTPYVFLNIFLKEAQADEHLEMVSSFLVELCFVEYVMLRYPPSLLAAAAVYTGQSILRRFPPWSRTMEQETAYTEDQLQECAKLMVGFHQNSQKGNLIAVHNKYMDKFRSVAQLPPFIFAGERGL